MSDINAEFKFCPLCGSSKGISYVKRRHWVCSDCGFDLYNNVASAVGLIIQDSEGRVLLEKRAKEPRKGFLALPGGFVDPDERAEDAAVRECLEEIGLVPESISFVCTCPNTYEYKNIVYKTCDMFFSAKLKAEDASSKDLIKRLTPQESEVSGFELHKIDCIEDVDSIPLAFDSAKVALKAFIERGIPRT